MGNKNSSGNKTGGQAKTSVETANTPVKTVNTGSTSASTLQNDGNVESNSYTNLKECISLALNAYSTVPEVAVIQSEVKELARRIQADVLEESSTAPSLKSSTNLCAQDFMTLTWQVRVCTV
jgi:hypothetical protein